VNSVMSLVKKFRRLATLNNSELGTRIGFVIFFHCISSSSELFDFPAARLVTHWHQAARKNFQCQAIV